jgi:hypothetical protein
VRYLSPWYGRYGIKTPVFPGSASFFACPPAGPDVPRIPGSNAGTEAEASKQPAIDAIPPNWSPSFEGHVFPPIVRELCACEEPRNLEPPFSAPGCRVRSLDPKRTLYFLRAPASSLASFP